MQPEAPRQFAPLSRRSWLPGRADLLPPEAGGGGRRRKALGCLAAAAAALVLAGLAGAWALAAHGDAIVHRLAYWVSTNIMLQVDSSYDQATKAGLRDELASFFELGFRGQVPPQQVKPVLDRLKLAMEDGAISGAELAPILADVRAVPVVPVPPPTPTPPAAPAVTAAPGGPP